VEKERLKAKISELTQEPSSLAWPSEEAERLALLRRGLRSHLTGSDLEDLSLFGLFLQGEEKYRAFGRPEAGSESRRAPPEDKADLRRAAFARRRLGPFEDFRPRGKERKGFWGLWSLRKRLRPCPRREPNGTIRPDRPDAIWECPPLSAQAGGYAQKRLGPLKNKSFGAKLPRPQRASQGAGGFPEKL